MKNTKIKEVNCEKVQKREERMNNVKINVNKLKDVE